MRTDGGKIEIEPLIISYTDEHQIRQHTLWMSSTNKQTLDDRNWHLHTDLKFLSKTRARWVGDNGSQQQIISVQIEWLRNTEAPELYVFCFLELGLGVDCRQQIDFDDIYEMGLIFHRSIRSTFRSKWVEPEVRWFAHLSTTASGLELAARVAQRLT